MTPFQRSVVDQLRSAARITGLELRFEERGVHAVARFEWRGDERLVLVSDGELILEWDGEHYFEVPVDAAHVEVRRFVALLRLCLEGWALEEARQSAIRHVPT